MVRRLRQRFGSVSPFSEVWHGRHKMGNTCREGLLSYWHIAPRAGSARRDLVPSCALFAFVENIYVKIGSYRWLKIHQQRAGWKR